VKGERPNRTAEHKKNTMKTQSQNQISEAQSRPEQLSTAANTAKASRPPIDFKLRRFNKRLNTEKLLALLEKEAPEFFQLAEVVGKWVWIQLDGKQPVEITSTLSEFGFHWNRTRQLWQHPCNSFDPRKFYGHRFAAPRA
jgi:hypothetical protein